MNRYFLAAVGPLYALMNRILHRTFFFASVEPFQDWSGDGHFACQSAQSSKLLSRLMSSVKLSADGQKTGSED